MNVTKITTDDQIKYDPFLVETIVKPRDKENILVKKNESNENWDIKKLNDTISSLENSIQKVDDSSPLSYKSAPSINNITEASKLIKEIDYKDLTQNINKLFDNLNTKNISKLFIEAADMKL
ncbi:MAG: hypothetical protein ACE364_01880 [Chlorobiota bacterium]